MPEEPTLESIVEAYREHLREMDRQAGKEIDRLIFEAFFGPPKEESD